MFRPDFGQSFFEKHQWTLAAFMNTRVGRSFFALAAVEIPDGDKVHAVGPGWVSHGWVRDGDRIIKKTTCFSGPRFQHRLERAYQHAEAVMGQAVAAMAIGKPVEHGFALVPLLALTVTGPLYPVAGANSPADGHVERYYSPSQGTAQTAWATMRALATGDSAQTNSTAADAPALEAGTVSGGWHWMGYAHFFFDTSSIPDSDVVSAADVQVYVVSKTTTLASQSVSLVQSTITSNTTIATSDMNKWGTTKWATDLTLAGITASAYNTWAMNSTGYGSLVLTGISKVALAIASIIENAEPTWVSGNSARLNVRFADQSGTTSDPKITITHAAAGWTAAPQFFQFF